MKKLLLTASLFLVLTGCDHKPQPPQMYPPRFFTESWQDQPGEHDPGLYIAIVRDTETHARYIVIQSSHGTSITPLIERLPEER